MDAFTVEDLMELVDWLEAGSLDDTVSGDGEEEE